VAKIETLYKTKWLSLKKMTLEDVDVEYIYVHSEASDGIGVAVLPYRSTGEDSREFLIRKEIVPPWNLDQSPCSLTGMHEGGSCLETAARELKEESGYEVDPSEIFSLGSVHNSKASDTEIHIFSVDLTGKELGSIEGDGSILEAMGTYEWVTDVFISKDSILLAMYAHLMEHFRTTEVC